MVNESSNAMVSDLAKDPSVYYLDIGNQFLEDDQTLSREIMLDLLHLSEEGYEIWAKLLNPHSRSFFSDPFR